MPFLAHLAVPLFLTALLWQPSVDVPFAGDFLGRFAENGPGWFTARYCGESDETRAWFRNETKAPGYTHLLVTWALKYRNYKTFNLADDPDRFRACLDEVIADRLIPVTVAVQSEEFGVSDAVQRPFVEPTWRRLVSAAGCQRMPHLIVAWEMDDFIPSEHHYELATMVVESCSDSKVGLHFSPGRIAPGDVDARAYWREMQRRGVDALYFQASMRDDPKHFSTQIAEAMRSVPIPVVAFEFNDPHNPHRVAGRSEHWGLVLGCAAMKAGAAGFLNGGPTLSRPCPPE